MKDVIIYQDGPDNWRYDARSQWMENLGHRKKIVYRDGILYVLDDKQSAKIDITVSRWQLVEIALSCLLAAVTSGR